MAWPWPRGGRQPPHLPSWYTGVRVRSDRKAGGRRHRGKECHAVSLWTWGPGAASGPALPAGGVATSPTSPRPSPGTRSPRSPRLQRAPASRAQVAHGAPERVGFFGVLGEKALQQAWHSVVPGGPEFESHSGLPSQVSGSVSSGESGEREYSSPVLGGSGRPTPGLSLTCSAAFRNITTSVSPFVRWRVLWTSSKASAPPPSWDLQLWRVFPHTRPPLPRRSCPGLGARRHLWGKYWTESCGWEPCCCQKLTARGCRWGEPQSPHLCAEHPGFPGRRLGRKPSHFSFHWGRERLWSGAYHFDLICLETERKVTKKGVFVLFGVQADLY